MKALLFVSWGLLIYGISFSVRAIIGMKKVNKLFPDELVSAFLELYSTNQKNATAAFLYALAFTLTVVYFTIGR